MVVVVVMVVVVMVAVAGQYTCTPPTLTPTPAR